MLSSITDRELIARLEQLRGHERDAALELLHHLNEVERRNLYLRLGYSSLFTYCVGHLCYSESDAGRRVQAARCLHRFPRVATLLKSGEINMVTLGLVANIVTESTIDQWLERIRGKSQREVEALAATVRAPITLRDRARLVNVVVPVTAPLPLAPAAKTDGKKFDGAESPLPLLAPPPPVVASAPPAGRQHPPVVTQSRVYIQFLADQSFMIRYRIAASLLSNKFPRLTFEAVFGALIDEFIHRHAPEERHARREKAATARGAETASRDAIPARTRDAVFARDLGRCTFVGSDGKRCDETIRLHVDHIKPVAHGGSNEITNLRLLCARHNMLQAEKILGRKAMSGFRKSS